MIMIVVGTRPEIVKMASVIQSCKKKRIRCLVVHAAQHYDWEMSERFMQELGLGKPDKSLRVGSGSHARQTARAMVELEKTILCEEPNAVVVQGDTNTVLATSLAAVKQHVPVCHVEAGLRSYDCRMPEEHNRRLVDHISSLLFAPTSRAAATLRKEHVWGQVSTVGNSVIDACLKYLQVALRKSTILDEVVFNKFALATFHRAENVDSMKGLNTIVNVLSGCPVPVVFPVHPRTRQRLKSFSLMSRLVDSRNVQLLPPVGYFDILTLMQRCEFILTDSGGIQEEATSPNIRKFTFVLRKRTDRPESIDAGFAELLGVDDCNSILHSIKSTIRCPPILRNQSPYGDGKTGLRIAEKLRTSEWLHSNKLLI